MEDCCIVCGGSAEGLTCNGCGRDVCPDCGYECDVETGEEREYYELEGHKFCNRFFCPTCLLDTRKHPCAATWHKEENASV